eukprot:596561-Pyramimonas_sp.AAC.1
MRSRRKEGTAGDTEQLRVMFNADEIRNLFGNFRSARQTDQEAAEAWRKIDDKALRTGKTLAKRKLLTAFLKDPG